MSKSLIVRVLVNCVIAESICQSGELVRAESSVFASYLKEGVVDKTKAGIDYAKSQGVEVRDLALAEPEPEPESESESEQKPE